MVTGERKATTLYATRDQTHYKATRAESLDPARDCHHPRSHPSQLAQRHVGRQGAAHREKREPKSLEEWKPTPEASGGGADRTSESGGWRRVSFWLLLRKKNRKSGA